MGLDYIKGNEAQVHVFLETLLLVSQRAIFICLNIKTIRPMKLLLEDTQQQSSSQNF